MSDTRAKLRELLQGDEPVVAPGATSALFARLIEDAGFPAVYMTGAGVAHSLLGRPDLGLTTLTEMTQQAESLARATDIPLIADADTGFGGVLNVRRTVELYESRGVAAIQIEDQVNPKRCGHFDGKEVVSLYEMTSRIRAAVAGRTDPNLVIIARTDARATDGLDAAIERGRAFIEAGADALFLEAPQTVEEMTRIGEALGHVPLVSNMVDGGITPQLSAAELFELGFRIVIFPGFLTRITMKAARDALATLRQTGDSRVLHPEMAGFSDVNTLLGLPDLTAAIHDYEREG